MAKSAKNKKEKASDFTKRKLKLGKGKQIATNAIDTSFKARSIALPQQSITVTNETSVPTTKRKLTLDALLAHLKHYGAGVRKDSLQGLQEILGEHPELIELNLSKLVNSCVRLISDEDAGVRKALHSFFAWLLPRIPKEQLLPHASPLLLFTASAQSHIFLEIRIDAIRLLDLLLELVPGQVVTGFWGTDSGGIHFGHGRKLLDGYLGLLNVGARFNEDDSKSAGPSAGIGGQSSTLVTLSGAAKASILKSFSRFLYHAMEQMSQEISSRDNQPDEMFPLWFLSGDFRSQEAFASFSSVLRTQRSVGRSQRQTRTWSEIGEDNFTGAFPLSGISNSLDASNLLDVENVLTEIERLSTNEKFSDGLDSSNGRLLFSLCRTLHPVLVSTFLDCAPSVFSPSEATSETELELVYSLMDIARCLYGHLLRDTSIPLDQKEAARKDLESLVVHMSAYFPFGENRMFAPDLKSENSFQSMNLIYCELFSLRSLSFTSSSEGQGDVQGPKTKRRKLNHLPSNKPSTTALSETGSTKQTGRVREYVIQCLRGTASGTASMAMTPLGQSLTAQTYIGLLPTLWWLLNRPDPEDSAEVLEAVLRHAAKTGSTSGVKAVATEFVGRLVLLQTEPSYRGSFGIGSFLSDDLQKALRDWLYHLPKVLWELGDKDTTATELILLFILRMTQRRSWLNNMETTVALCTRFAPFFTVQHATRGELRGPYARLNKSPSANSDPNNTGSGSSLKRLAIDVAAVLVSTTLRSAPRKISPRTGKRTGDIACSVASSSDPVSVMTELISAAEARYVLGTAVGKAVSGTVEEVYWLGVSQL